VVFHFIVHLTHDKFGLFFSAVELELLCIKSQGEVCSYFIIYVVTLCVFMDPHTHNKMFHDDERAWVCYEQCQITLKLTRKLSLLFLITAAVLHL